MSKAIITGGAIRVGRAISLALAEAGYDIILIFNTSFDEAKKTAEEIAAMNKKCYLYKADISLKESIDNVFGDISRKFDDVSVLINNASVFGKYGFMDTTEQIFDAHMNTNLKAPFFLSQNFAYYISRHEYIADASIINILDARINEIHTGHFAYHLTKKSLDDLTQMLAKELAPKIRVNSISLGKILPLKQENVELNPDEYPKLREITAEVKNLLMDKKVTGKNVFIEADPKL